jgi:hypothetical protein
MHRRDLLKYLLTTPLATFVDYEKLLWVPDKRIFIPNKNKNWEEIMTLNANLVWNNPIYSKTILYIAS